MNWGAQIYIDQLISQPIDQNHKHGFMSNSPILNRAPLQNLIISCPFLEKYISRG